MKHLWRSFIRTLIAGILFLAPLLLLLLIAVHAIRLIGSILKPVAAHLPFPSMLGLQSPEVAAAVLLIVLTLIAGLVAQTALARRMSERVERLVLKKLPGYTLIKSVARGAIGESADVKAALANIDDAWLLAFIVEDNPAGSSAGLLTVFVPSAPTPTAGSVYFLREEQVKRLDVPVSSAIQCVMQLGVGSRRMLEGTRTPS